MEFGLRGRKIAILATDGVEQVELEQPRRALDAAGAVTHLISITEGSIQAMNHDEKGARVPVDHVLADVRASDYDALLLPGGVGNPDRLRTEPLAVQFARASSCWASVRSPPSAMGRGCWWKRAGWRDGRSRPGRRCRPTSAMRAASGWMRRSGWMTG